MGNSSHGAQATVPEMPPGGVIIREAVLARSIGPKCIFQHFERFVISWNPCLSISMFFGV